MESKKKTSYSVTEQTKQLLILLAKETSRTPSSVIEALAKAEAKRLRIALP